MKHTKHRLLALLLALVMVIGAMPAMALLVGAEEATATVIEVDENGAITNLTWGTGYVGSSYHDWDAWKVMSTRWDDSYRLSDIVAVPKAGTTLVWTESAANGVMSENAFFLTSWKEANGIWTVDLAGVNLIADSKIRNDGQVNHNLTYDKSANTVTYTYTTTRDNETLRFGCYGKGLAAAECPTVYAYTPVFADGTVSGLKWFAGYVGSATNTNGYRNEIKAPDTVYSYSAPLIVPKAGTTVTFTDNDGKCCSSAAYAFSTWTIESDGLPELFYGLAGNNTADVTEAWIDVTEDGYVYSYTTAYDNEVIRLCYRDDNQDEPVVSYVEDNAEVVPPVLVQAGYDPTQTGTSYLKAGWKTGSVGVLSNTFVLGADDYGYRVSDIIPVVGKGTTITFTDVIGAAAAEAGADNFIGSDRYAISSFYGADYTGKNSNDIKSVDPSLGGVKGLADYTAAIEDGKCVYSYTTTQDVEYIRVSLRDVGNFSAAGEESKTGFIAPIIYITAPNAGNHSSVLEDLTVYAIGDSYLDGNGVDRNEHWLTRLAAEYDWNYINYGINGSAVSSYADATKHTPMVNRYMNMRSNDDVDLIIFEGGRNDYNANVPIGTMDSEDPKTFIGAVKIMIDGLLQKYPNAVIVCMTAWDLSEMTTGSNKLNAAGNRCEDYARAFTDYVNSLDNARVCMMDNADRSVMPVQMTTAFYRAEYCQTANDISHLNISGMKLVLPWVEARIAELYGAYADDCAASNVSFTFGDVTYSLAATYADNEISVPAAPLSVNDYTLGWAGVINGEKTVLRSGQALALKAGDVGYFEPVSVHMEQAGAPGVRFEEGSTGLRFLTSVSLSDYNYGTDLLEGTGVEIEFGTLIVPYQYVVEMKGVLTHDSLAAADMLHLDIPCNISGGTDWYKRDDANDLGYIAGSIASIKTKNYARAFTAAGYAKIEFADGSVSYVYADGAGKNASSVYEVSYKAMNDRADEYSGIYQYRDAYNTYTPYTTQQLEILEQFLDPVVSLKSLTDTTVIVNNSKYYTSNSFVMTAVTAGNADWNALVDAVGDDEVTVVYVIEAADGTELAEGNYGGLLLDGYELTPVYYKGKLLIGLSEYSAYY